MLDFILNGEPYTFKMQWEYDSWNRIRNITYPDGEQVDYGYNDAGQLTNMSSEKTGNNYDFINQISYDKFGSRKLVEYGNNTISEYTYDAQSRRLSNLKTWDAQGGVMQDINYGYIDNGNIDIVTNSATSIANNMGGIYDYTHTYDSLSRLIGSVGNFTNSQNSNYDYELNMQYSASGNITQKQMNATTLIGGVVQNVSYSNNYIYNNSSQPHTVTGINNTHDMTWDANGNMTALTDNTKGLNRNMCWDEENRLTVVKDRESTFSHYIYNAGGERVWKLTGSIERMMINGRDFVDQARLEKTLYASPYMILTEREYTKHYYIESQRVTTKLGGGMANHLVNPISGTLEPIEDGINIIAENLYENLILTQCTEGVNLEIEPVFRNMEELMQQDNQERDQYFYHSDHLGSSAWITDASGNVNQHMQYMPFGESFINQRSEHDVRFKFTGKERDSETGFDYFGARYYSSDISVWLSVDPLASKYPSTSPYAYVENNPVMYIDPNGMFKTWIGAFFYKLKNGGEIRKDPTKDKDAWFVGKTIGHGTVKGKDGKTKKGEVTKGVDGVSVYYKRVFKRESKVNVRGVSIDFAISWGQKGIINGVNLSLLFEDDNFGATFTTYKNGDGYEVTVLGASYVTIESTGESEAKIEDTYGPGDTWAGGVWWFNGSISGNNGAPVPSSFKMISKGLALGAPVSASHYDTFTGGYTWKELFGNEE